jgi:hypothetical protein
MGIAWACSHKTPQPTNATASVANITFIVFFIIADLPLFISVSLLPVTTA